MANLVRIERVKTYLDLANTDTASDVLLQDLIARIGAWAERYCDRSFAKATYTEQRDGDGTDTLLVRQWPLLSVASLYDDPLRVFGAATQIAATDFAIYANQGMIRLDGRVFSVGIQNVKVTYEAGYADIPEDLQQAVVELVADRFRNKENQGIRSLAIGSYRVDYGEEELPSEIRGVLDGYRRTRVS